VCQKSRKNSGFFVVPVGLAAGQQKGGKTKHKIRSETGKYPEPAARKGCPTSPINSVRSGILQFCNFGRQPSRVILFPMTLNRRAWHKVVSILLLAVSVFVLGLISTSMMSANMLAEARYALKMESLAKAVAGALQDNFRTNSVYPDELANFHFDGGQVFGELGVKSDDMKKLKYFADNSGFILTYETRHFRFIFTGHGMKGISLLEPMSKKVDS
jgi:hypothetical protein